VANHFIPISAHSVFFNAQFEEDLHTLRSGLTASCKACDYAPKPEATSPEFLELYVHDGHNKSGHTINFITGNDTVKELKLRIMKHVSLPPDKQRLFVGGKEITTPEDSTLAQLNIQTHSHILLALKNLVPEKELLASEGTEKEEAATIPSTFTTTTTVTLETSTIISPTLSELIGKESEFSDVAFILEDEDHIFFAHRVSFICPLMKGLLSSLTFHKRL